jgi:hypothetical protein
MSLDKILSDDDIPSSPEIVLTPEIIEEAQEEEADDDVDTSIEKILASEKVLPKDFGEINVRGHLRFDEEMPPDEETQNNTIHNALMYQLGENIDEDDNDNNNNNDDHIHHHHHHHHHHHDSHHYHHHHHSQSRAEEKVLTFDTYSPNTDATHYQTTMVHQDKDFRYTTHTRTFMVPYNDDKPAFDAITWTLKEMVNDNDIVVVIKVVSLQYILKHGVQAHRKQCKDLFKSICHHNKDNIKIRILVEIRIGSVEFAIARALKEFDPTFLVMGTKGIRKAKFTNFLNEDTSLTKHFIDNGRIPVVVLNPLYEPSTHERLTIKNHNFFKNLLASYPSVYDPIHASQTLEMERSSSASSTNTRTPRFLRISKNMSRSSSVNSRSTNTLSPSTSHDISPVSSAGRALSPRRGLSPFRLFHRK